MDIINCFFEITRENFFSINLHILYNERYKLMKLLKLSPAYEVIEAILQCFIEMNEKLRTRIIFYRELSSANALISLKSSFRIFLLKY